MRDSTENIYQRNGGRISGTLSANNDRKRAVEIFVMAFYTWYETIGTVEKSIKTNNYGTTDNKRAIGTDGRR